MMYKNARSTLPIIIILTLAAPLFGMDVRQRFVSGVAKMATSDSIESIPTLGRTFKKSWQQRIMICASLFVQCINNCCGHDVDHDENGNSDYLDYVRQKPAAVNIPAVPVSVSALESPIVAKTANPPAKSVLVPLSVSASTPTSTSGTADAHVARAPVSKPMSLSELPTAPGTDDEFILNHYQEPRARLESALANAPIEAMDLLDMLKYPSLYSHKVRFAVLYGPPGIAKSTLAKAIVWKAGWFLELIVGRQVRAEHRGGASIKLQNKFAEIIVSKRDTVIVIDEINRFFENYNSTKYDTGDTAEDFWTFLDEQKRNTHLYIIGTANRIDQLPPQIRSRARNRFIKIDPAGGIESTILRFKQVFDEHVLSPACDQAFLTQFLTPLHENGWRIRDFESLSESAATIARRTDKVSAQLTITPAQLQEALEGILKTDIDSKYGTEAESEEERHHRENLEQQKELHIDTKTMQQAQFVQGLFINKKMNSDQENVGGNIGWSIGTSGANISGGVSYGINNISKDDKCITDYLSDEQLRLHIKQQQERAQREFGQARVNRLLQDLAGKTSMFERRLVQVNSLGSLSLITKVNQIKRHRQQLADNFESIQVPSPEEVDTVCAKIIQLNKELDTLEPQNNVLAGAMNINLLFEDFVKRAYEYKQILAPINSSSAQSLIDQADCIARNSKQLSAILKKIEVPTQKELNIFTHSAGALLLTMEKLQAKIEALVAPAPNSGGNSKHN